MCIYMFMEIAKLALNWFTDFRFLFLLCRFWELAGTFFQSRDKKHAGDMFAERRVLLVNLHILIVGKLKTQVELIGSSLAISQSTVIQIKTHIPLVYIVIP